jgi:hypothetical protein
MFPFDRPSNYSEMLNKIGTFTFLVALGMTWVVAYFVPEISTFLHSQTATVEVLTLKIPLLYVVPAVVIAIIARVIRLHDKLSDLFKIRSYFDVHRILLPLCKVLGIPVDKAFTEKLKKHRESAMGKTFYVYASFEDPVISKALVLSAIDRWTWYWVLLEASVILLLGAITLLLFGAYGGAGLMFILLILAGLLFSTYYNVCGRLADHQIEAIADDGQRVTALRKEFLNIRAHA